MESAVGATLPPASRRPTKDEQAVFDLLPSGRANAVTQKRLADRAGISVRDLQDTLKALTEECGLPIVASCRKPMGVFVPETSAEVSEYVAQLRSRAVSCFKRISALNKAEAATLSRELRQMEIGFPAPSLRVAGPVCPQCDEPFTRSRTTQIYCSPECRFDAARERTA